MLLSIRFRCCSHSLLNSVFFLCFGPCRGASLRGPKNRISTTKRCPISNKLLVLISLFSLSFPRFPCLFCFFFIFHTFMFDMFSFFHLLMFSHLVHPSFSIFPETCHLCYGADGPVPWCGCLSCFSFFLKKSHKNEHPIYQGHEKSHTYMIWTVFF